MGRGGYDQSICWDCRKACGGCSWVDEFIPVKGWKACQKPIKAEHNGQDLILGSYLVRSCPEFIRDSKERLQKVVKEC